MLHQQEVVYVLGINAPASEPGKFHSLKVKLVNAPDSALQVVIDLLPGLESPTVLPLARTGMHAVHAVVDRQQVVELLGPLRGAGASSILVLPIENLVP